MRKMLFMLVLSIAMLAIAGMALAQNAPAPSAPSGVLAPPTQAAPPPDASKMMPIGARRREFIRPASCILPTLRIVSPQMLPMLTASLNLNDEAKTKVLDVLTKFDKVLKLKIDEQTKLVRAYAETLISPTATEAEITAAAEKAMKAEADIMAVKIQALFALKGTLTPDQNKQLLESLSQSTRPWREAVSRPIQISPSVAPSFPVAPPPAK